MSEQKIEPLRKIYYEIVERVCEKHGVGVSGYCNDAVFDELKPIINQLLTEACMEAVDGFVEYCREHDTNEIAHKEIKDKVRYAQIWVGLTAELYKIKLLEKEKENIK
jgi:hypothetical protein